MHFLQLQVLVISALVVAKQLDNVIYTNAEGFIKCAESAIIRPQTVDQVQQLVREAFSTGKSIKPAGAGHSTNEIICSSTPVAGGIILQMEDMNSIVSVDQEKLQVTVQAGAALVKFFKDMIPYKMTIEGMVDYGAITVAGSIATGAHSSSLKVHSGVADHIIGCKLVNGRGELITLTHQDRDFAAIHTNLGALGILVEVTFQAVPLFKVRGKQIPITDLDAMPDQLVGLVKQHDWANLYWFSSNNKAILHTYNKVDASTPGKGTFLLFSNSLLISM